MTAFQNKWIKLWLFWIVAIIIGNLEIAHSVIEFITSRIYIDYYSPLFFVFAPLYFILSGCISGVAQWLVISKHIHISGWLWIFTTIFESIITVYILDIGSGFAEFVLGRVAIGFLLGSSQWLILRKNISHAGWWIIILMTGHLITAIVAIAIVTVFETFLFMFRIEMITSVLYGVLTGAGLIILLMQSSKKENEQVDLS